ncbi:putative Ca2+/H+ antiporter (TMEM165/GDT1 family) [Motilibacter rhizosphaerae]|uniref:GDT1 family protein n=1 Tax=Motilibacter rhizosphaerae TaxID=598652 RepID=A0A4V2F502_9ACTN|nr:TMEM165/GDT1 family protein [Motilibacter rhizosphaerae]RZS91109.1 putative Ca2+/H+ antiporter (TMEM165/GDT1 family) [Motilibacter rhizosphaerae]
MHLLGLDLAVVATAFLPLLLLELPDKTFIATLVLSTRYRPLTAWLGVGLAFGVQCLIAVTAGGLLARLPELPVALAAALLFAVGGVLLWRGAAAADEEEAETEEEIAAKVTGGGRGLRAVVACFLVIFVAEWGDLSQLFTAGLAARYDDPVSVFVGAWAALLVVAGLGALLGKALLARLRLSTVRRAGAVVCAVLVVVTLVEAVRLA